jgi:hypothetical protein
MLCYKQICHYVAKLWNCLGVSCKIHIWCAYAKEIFIANVDDKRLPAQIVPMQNKHSEIHHSLNSEFQKLLEKLNERPSLS